MTLPRSRPSPTPRPMTARTRSVAAATIAIALSSVLGCAPEPAPVPTPKPAFASEEEAFAAAEEVYRAYNDALNMERAGATSGDSLDYLTGLVLEQEIRTAQELQASGIRIEGATRITQFQAIVADVGVAVAEVKATVCLDISEVRAVDASGTDVTAAGRSDTYAIEVRFTGDRESLAIAQYEVRTDSKC